MNDDDVTGLPYIGEDEYTFECTDGTSVTVNIRDRSPGGRVGVYHYDEDGSRMNYYPFNISNVNDPSLTYPKEEEGVPIPESISRALHAGGWMFENLQNATLEISPDQHPWEVELLNARDAFASWEWEDRDTLSEFYSACARIMEQAVVTTEMDRRAEMRNTTLEDGVLESVPHLDEITVEENVENMIMNAVDPDGRISMQGHKQIVNLYEQARRYYRGGLDWDDAVERASEEVDLDAVR